MSVFRKVGDTEIRVYEGQKLGYDSTFVCRLRISLSAYGVEQSVAWLERNTLNMISQILAEHKGAEINWLHPDDEE